PFDRTIAYQIGHGKTMNFDTPFNTLSGYVMLVIPSSYASDARFRGAAMSVRTFPMMHMGFSTKTNSATDARLPQRSRPKTIALSRVIRCAGTFDALRADSFTGKCEIAQANSMHGSRRGMLHRPGNGGHAFG
ncbi:MAG: hypothetical protein KDB27_16615, partial [Planctomycetales bacterium]|nr:hypothetical protein [Planctomycetales bacterium]